MSNDVWPGGAPGAGDPIPEPAAGADLPPAVPSDGNSADGPGEPADDGYLPL